jgi:hypothetical protein
MIDWYRSGHQLPAEAMCDQLAWLEAAIDLPTETASC